MNTIQHNNTIQFPQKTLKFYKFVLYYCVVLCCFVFFWFFLIVPKTTQCSNTIHATIYGFLENNTIQYNTITKYNFCKKPLNFTKLYCVIVLFAFFCFLKLFQKQHNATVYSFLETNTIPWPQYNTIIFFSTIQYNTIQYNTIQYNRMQSFLKKHIIFFFGIHCNNTIIALNLLVGKLEIWFFFEYNTIQYNAIFLTNFVFRKQYNTIQYNAMQYFDDSFFFGKQYNTIQHNFFKFFFTKTIQYIQYNLIFSTNFFNICFLQKQYNTIQFNFFNKFFPHFFFENNTIQYNLIFSKNFFINSFLKTIQYNTI